MSDIVAVEPMRSGEQNSPVVEQVDAESTVVMEVADRVCFWNGVQYAEGARVDADGALYECSLGKWVRA